MGRHIIYIKKLLSQKNCILPRIGRPSTNEQGTGHIQAVVTLFPVFTKIKFIRGYMSGVLIRGVLLMLRS